jgi:hypothetical protein
MLRLGLCGRYIVKQLEKIAGRKCRRISGTAAELGIARQQSLLPARPYRSPPYGQSCDGATGGRHDAQAKGRYDGFRWWVFFKIVDWEGRAPG